MKTPFIFIFLLLPLLGNASDPTKTEAYESIRRGIIKSSFALALNLIEARKEGLMCASTLLKTESRI